MSSSKVSKYVVLKKGREKSLLRRHPWIFSGAVHQVKGAPQSGETVEVRDFQGHILALGAFSPHSQIRVRVWTFDLQETIDEAFFCRKIEQAIHLRQKLNIEEQSNAFRLVAAEADGLPGLIVDRYNDWLVCQFLSAGSEFWKETIVECLKQFSGVSKIYERSDVEVRKKEGLPLRKGPMSGPTPPAFIEIEEHGLKILVDVEKGHKTGFYLDQRVNRQLVARHSANKKVLNCFAYTGGFGLAALQGGAQHVTNVEDVAGLLEVQEKNFRLNGFASSLYKNVKADVFQLLRQYREQGQKFDLIVLDPPKFADSQRNLLRASRGYKDINRLAFSLLRPGGLLFTFSCSGLMNSALFQKIVADAALEAGCDVQLLQGMLQAPDHPIKLHIPETWYLKGLVCQV